MSSSKIEIVGLSKHKEFKLRDKTALTIMDSINNSQQSFNNVFEMQKTSMRLNSRKGGHMDRMSFGGGALNLGGAGNLTERHRDNPIAMEPDNPLQSLTLHI
jgi:hypothetical protein